MPVMLKQIAAAALLALGASAAVAVEAAPGEDAALKTYCNTLTASFGSVEKSAQAQSLIELEEKLQQRIAELSAKQAELRDMLRQREEMTKRADATLVDIYAKMRPEAAAAQISAMDEATAVALLIKLSTRSASAILNEIQPARAARLTEAIALAGGKTTQKKS